MILTFPIAFFWVMRTLKKWDFREAIEEDIIPLRIVSRFVILVLPLIVGETLAVIACLLSYPDASESILYRGFSYYLVVFGGLFLVFSVFYLRNRRKRKDIDGDSTQIQKEE